MEHLQKVSLQLAKNERASSLEHYEPLVVTDGQLTGSNLAREYVMEPKLDGFRAGIIKRGSTVTIYSRTWKEQPGKLPHLERALTEVPHDFHLDGELVHLRGVEDGVPMVDFNRTARVMGSNAGRAQAEQMKHGKLVFVAFDLIGFDDQDWRRTKQSIRRAGLEMFWQNWLQKAYVALLPQVHENFAETYDRYISLGVEGAMLKAQDAPYDGKRSGAWRKIKSVETADVVVIGFTQGGGKYSDTIGAIQFGQYRDGELVRRGQCSGMTDDLRYAISASPDAYIGRVMEVKHFGYVSEAEVHGFRHPQFVRFRDDKKREECTWD